MWAVSLVCNLYRTRRQPGWPRPTENTKACHCVSKAGLSTELEEMERYTHTMIKSFQLNLSCNCSLRSPLSEGAEIRGHVSYSLCLRPLALTICPHEKLMGVYVCLPLFAKPDPGKDNRKEDRAHLSSCFSPTLQVEKRHGRFLESEL